MGINETTDLVLETITVLARHGKAVRDIQQVQLKDKWCTWNDYIVLACDLEHYNSGFGSLCVNTDLMIVGADWWLERHEYDGSEWWEFKQLPNLLPETNEKITSIKDTW